MCELWIDGCGAVTPLGYGIQALSSLDDMRFTAGCLITIAPEDPLMKTVKRWSTSAQYAYAASMEAMAARRRKNVNPHRFGCVVGVNYSNLEAIISLNEDAQRFGVNNTNPGLFPETVLNSIGGHLAEKFQMSGVNATISDGDQTGWNVLRYAVDLLKHNQADDVLVCLVNRFPPDRFNMDTLPYSFKQESITSLLLTRRSEAGEQGNISFSMEEYQPDPDSDRPHEEAPPWNLPLAIGVAYARVLRAEQSSISITSSMPHRNGLSIHLEKKGGKAR